MNTMPDYTAEVWSLADDWLRKVQSAYDEHMLELSMLQKSALTNISIMFVMTTLLAAVSEFRNNFGSESMLASSGFKFALFGFFSFFDLFRKFQRTRISRKELSDIYYISRELFEMIISSEDRLADNRYEYLTRHVRILEIRNLLRKVERTINGNSLVLSSSKRDVAHSPLA